MNALNVTRDFKSLTKSMVATAVVNPQGVVLQASSNVQDFVGISASDFMGHNIFDYLHPDDVKEAIAQFSIAMIKGDVSNVFARMAHPDQTYHYVNCSAQAHQGIIHLVVVDEYNLDVLLEQVESPDVGDLFLSLKDTEMVWTFDTKLRRMTYLSPLAIRVFSRPELANVTTIEWDDVVAPDFNQLRSMLFDGQFIAEFISSRAKFITFEGHVINHENKQVPTRSFITFRKGSSGAEEVIAITRLLHTTSTLKSPEDYAIDELTHLPNRNALSALIRQTSLEAEQCRNIALIDLDQFAQVNSLLGREKADEILVEVSNRIKQAAAHLGQVYRFGSDEFLIIAPCTDQDTQTESLEGLNKAVNFTFEHGDKVLYISSKVGIAFGRSEETLATVLRHAQIAKDHAKNTGAKYYVFEPRIAVDSDQIQLLTDKLHQAIANNELEVFYQPVYDVRKGNIRHAEALMRWTNPTLGRIPPGDFIPIAEKTKLIIPMTDWLVATVCQQMANWREQGLPTTRVSLNLSIVSILYEGVSLAKRFFDMTQEYQIDPADIKIEITETTYLKDVDEVIDTMRALKSFGFRLALDDFGTGYSTFGYIKDLPVDMVKFDRSLIQDIEKSKKSQKILQSLIDIVKSLGLEVVIEGVETMNQYHIISTMGIHFVQGFLLSRALPHDAFTQFVAAPDMNNLLHLLHRESQLDIEEEPLDSIYEDDSIIKEKQRYRLLEKEYNVLHDLLGEVSKTILSAQVEDFESKISRALELAGKMVLADRVYIFEYDFQAQDTSNTYEWCADGIIPQIDELQHVPIEGIPEWVNAHLAHQAVVINDVFELDKENNIRQILEPQGVKSLITLPMWSGNTLYGFIGLDAVVKHHNYTSLEKRILSELSDLLMGAFNRQAVEKQLQDERLFLEQALFSVDEAVMVIDPEFMVKNLNERAESLLNIPRSKVIKQPILSLLSLHSTSTQEALDWQAMINATDITGAHELPRVLVKTSSGTQQISAVKCALIRGKEEHILGRVISIRDLTKTIQDSLKMQRLEDSTLDLVCVFGTDGTIVRANQRLLSKLGYTASDFIGKNSFDFIHPDDQQLTLDLIDSFNQRESTTGFINRYRHAMGHYIYLEWYSQRGEDGLGYATARDITSFIEREQHIRHLSLHDALTGLPNRRAIDEQIETYKTSSEGYPLAIFMVDVNHLKRLNDRLGHYEGDRLIRSIAQQLRQLCPSEAFVGRFGGDEFMILIPQMDVIRALALMNRLKKQVTDEAIPSGEPLISTGFSLAMNTQDLYSSMELADQMLYQAKKSH